MSKKTSGYKKQPSPAQSKPSPWGRRFAIAGGAGVVLALVAIVIFSKPPPSGVPEGTETLAVAAPQHVTGDIHPEGDVPAGGPHDPVWQNCGFYDTPVRTENAVHSLEHGTVWITYVPDVAGNQIDKLRDFTRRGDKVLVSPVPDQATPIMVTAWANQLELDDAGDQRLEQFVNEFESSHSAPEPRASCQGGVGTPSADDGVLSRFGR